MKDKSHYKVSDLGIGACFLANGAKLINLEPVDERRVAFVFLYEDSLSEQERNFWSGNLSVNARDYFLAIKELKARLHSFKREKLWS